LLGARVARLVAGHAEAKRYLVSVDASYRAALSPRSIVTLAGRAVLLDRRAADAFPPGPDRGGLIALRRADDCRQVPGAWPRPGRMAPGAGDLIGERISPDQVA